ncbi:M20 family peptidase [soil metagenome]
MDDARALDRFRQLLRIPTISLAAGNEPAMTDAAWAPFDSFISSLERLYPVLHATLERERVAGHSLLYRWPGRTGGDPVVLMAHYDVVPAADEGWTHPPFAAVIEGEGDDAVIWGRGTLDDKGALVATLEAVDRLVAEGFTPEHDLYLSFGHNEETYGVGAISIVDLLEARGIHPRLVIDEGGAIVEGIFPGVSDPIAVVGVSEKGIANVVLTVEQGGGHASTPPKLAATVRIARALERLNRRQFAARLGATNLEMIRTLGAHSTGAMRFVFTNLWLTKGIVRRIFGSLSDETRAISRTTMAVTQLRGSAAPNVLAERASATVNVRIAVGSTVAEVERHVRTAIADGRVAVTVDESSEPSPVSPTSGWAWDLVRDSIAATYPSTVVTPYIMLAGSDSRHFTRIAENVYRFSPFRMSGAQRASLHARDERMHVATWFAGIEFFVRVIRSS